MCSDEISSAELSAENTRLDFVCWTDNLGDILFGRLWILIFIGENVNAAEDNFIPIFVADGALHVFQQVVDSRNLLLSRHRDYCALINFG